MLPPIHQPVRAASDFFFVIYLAQDQLLEQPSLSVLPLTTWRHRYWSPIESNGAWNVRPCAYVISKEYKATGSNNIIIQNAKKGHRSEYLISHHPLQPYPSLSARHHSSPKPRRSPRRQTARTLIPLLPLPPSPARSLPPILRQRPLLLFRQTHHPLLPGLKPCPSTLHSIPSYAAVLAEGARREERGRVDAVDCADCALALRGGLGGFGAHRCVR